LNWLSPLSFEQKQKDIFAETHKNTGQWFLQDDKYQQWLNGKVLTNHLAGAGKTSLA
jgi:hypothetical protein